MNKVGVIIACVAMGLIILSTAIVTYLSSAEARSLEYVKISVNPQIEFISENDKVISYMALNKEAREICANEEFLGLEITDASKKFLDLCTRAGYIDFDDMDNAVGITVVSGLSQVLETKVYKTMQTYLIENQILGAVFESANDNETVKRAEDLGITTDRLSLVQAVMHYMPEDTDIKDIKNYSRPKIIKMLKDYHKELPNPTTDYTEDELNKKEMLLEINREQVAHHKEVITPETQKDFKSIYIANQKELKQKIRDNFNYAYDIWKNNHVNFVA